jgi:hypothetical protein
MTTVFDDYLQPRSAKAAERPTPSRLILLVVFEILVLGAAICLPAFGELASTQTSILTAPQHALHIVAAVWTAVLLPTLSGPATCWARSIRSTRSGCGCASVPQKSAS